MIAICAYYVGNVCGKHTAARDIIRDLEDFAKDGKTIQEFLDEVKSDDEDIEEIQRNQ